MNLKYYLLIFQLEGYRTLRFLKWIAKHYWEPTPKEKKEPVWTTKAKLLYWLAVLLFILTALYLLSTAFGLSTNADLGAYYFDKHLGTEHTRDITEHAQIFLSILLLIGFLWLNIYILLPLSLLLLVPYERVNRIRVKLAIQNKVVGLKQIAHLTVIGITGSYGKTSTKIVLHELLPKSLMTPKSFNTLFGIWKVVDYELNKHYRYFICEMGAYKRGDVKEFCQLVNPDIGVLTGINEQHLERFGSIENTIKAKFEVLAYTADGGIGIVNLDNQRVRENLNNFDNKLKRTLSHLQAPVVHIWDEFTELARKGKARPRIKLIGYTTEGHQSEYCHEILAIKNWKIENGKSICEIAHKDKTYNLATPLVGRGHLSNILAGIAVSLSCGEDINNILERASKLKQIPHRLELRMTPALTILDDTYSSNPSGFREALDTLNRFDGKKVLVTPGIVELGEKALDIHTEIGTLAAKICDEIVLVGKSKNIEAMHSGIVSTGYSADKITRLPNRAAALALLNDRAGTNQVILMENDLPDQYI